MKRAVTAALIALAAATAWSQFGSGMRVKGGIAIGSGFDGGGLGVTYATLAVETPIDFRLFPGVGATVEFAVISREGDNAIPITINQTFRLDRLYFGAGIGLHFLRGRSGSSSVDQLEYTNKFYAGFGLATNLFAEIGYLDSARFDSVTVRIGVQF